VNAKLDTAKFLLKQGIALTPLVSGEKRPSNKCWQDGVGAITDPRDLNGQDYGSMIWKGLLGIDIDVKNVDGLTNFAKLLDGLELPETLNTATANGGQHL
jgi:hypothetical protein